MKYTAPSMHNPAHKKSHRSDQPRLVLEILQMTVPSEGHKDVRCNKHQDGFKSFINCFGDESPSIA